MKAGQLLIAVLLVAGAARAVTVQQAGLGASANEDSCALTSPGTAFPSTTRQIFFRFVLGAVRSSDVVTVEWVDPAGTVESAVPYDQLPAMSSLCLLTQLPVGGYAAAGKPGAWTVRVTAGGRVLTSLPFRLEGSAEASGGLAVRRVTPQGNELVIEGQGFNTESIVHVAQYTSATGWTYIASMFPESLEPGRMRARLASLPPAEYVVFVKNGQTLSSPARFEIVTEAGYRLPFPAQEQWVITQPPNGGYSHWGRTQHAYDLAPRQGGCVVAMRGGIAITRDLGYGQTPRLRIFGNYITIQHDDGEYSHYGHLRSRSFKVRDGERVEQGQALALVGNSGYSFGTHLHVQVSRSQAISSPSIPFRFEDLPAAQQTRYRGSVVSANRSNKGDCSRPAAPQLLTSSQRFVTAAATAPAETPGAAAPAPTWVGSVGVAAWWSELTSVAPHARSLEVRLGWDTEERDLDLHLMSPSGRHYGPYGDRTGYDAGNKEEAFVISDPEPGLWRVSVQGMRGDGSAMPFRIHRSVTAPAPKASGWGGARRARR
ncbi:MAG: peptidoglycan DD-metalloendopeptidase family protein [Bryobacterales bacterium]|nr:peptidoglycan DD-metalloendopeptidase family protein [Bryobacterales bacterium]